MRPILSAAVAALIPAAVLAAEPLTVTVEGFENGVIPQKFAYCVPDTDKHTAPGANVSPAISWTKGPEGTKSYAVVVVDHDVPQVFDDANQEGKTIPADMPRQDFHHWALVDVPASVTSLPEGAGKAPAKIGRAGVTDYVTFKISEPTPENIAAHSAYDGPCPPWNDARVHRYHFKIFALGVEKLSLKDGFTGKDALAALAPHVLAMGEAVGSYTQNPALMKK